MLRAFVSWCRNVASPKLMEIVPQLPESFIVSSLTFGPSPSIIVSVCAMKGRSRFIYFSQVNS